MATSLLAAIDPATLEHLLAQICAGDRLAQLRQRQEERVLSGLEETAIDELRGHTRDEPVPEREDAHDLELRLLTQPAQLPDAAQEKAQHDSARSVNALCQCLDHRLRFARAARELQVGCDRVGREPQVVGHGPQQMRRVLGPSRDAEIDLRDCAVAVTREEACQLSLEVWRKRAGAVPRRELGRTLRAQGIPRSWILARRTRDFPERQVHLRRGVVG